MKKFLAFILSIGMCFSIVGCGKDNSPELQTSQSSQQTLEDSTTQNSTEEHIDDICDLSNEKIKELANKLKKASVYPITYTDNDILAERLIVYQARVMLNDACAAFEEAQNSRPIRVYNAATGQWEMQPNQQAIEAAAEQVVISYNLLGGAILNANATIEGVTYGKIIADLENFTATTSSIRLILFNSLEYYEKLPDNCMQYSQYPEYTTNIPAWVNDISKIIKDFCGIEL